MGTHFCGMACASGVRAPSIFRRYYLGDIQWGSSRRVESVVYCIIVNVYMGEAKEGTERHFLRWP